MLYYYYYIINTINGVIITTYTDPLPLFFVFVFIYFFFFIIFRGVGSFRRRSHNAETEGPPFAVLHVFRANGPAPDHRSDPVVVQKAVRSGRRRRGDNDRRAPHSPGYQSPVVRLQHKGEPTCNGEDRTPNAFFFYNGRGAVLKRVGN